jgi:hypothetical protein
MPYTRNGNPLTFKNGTLQVTPLTQNGNITANAPIINLVVKSGSFESDATEAEADTNIFGRLITSGNQKSTLEMELYISQANLTTPLTPGTVWPMTGGDYLTANLTTGMANIIGTFMISKQSLPSLDPNEVLNFSVSLTSHGNLANQTFGVMSANGTLASFGGGDIV